MEGQHFDAHNVLDILDCDNSDAGDSDSSSDNECWEQIQVKALLIVLLFVQMKFRFPISLAN